MPFDRVGKLVYAVYKIGILLCGKLTGHEYKLGKLIVRAVDHADPRTKPRVFKLSEDLIALICDDDHPSGDRHIQNAIERIAKLLPSGQSQKGRKSGDEQRFVLG